MLDRRTLLAAVALCRGGMHDRADMSQARRAGRDVQHLARQGRLGARQRRWSRRCVRSMRM